MRLTPCKLKCQWKHLASWLGWFRVVGYFHINDWPTAMYCRPVPWCKLTSICTSVSDCHTADSKVSNYLQAQVLYLCVADLTCLPKVMLSPSESRISAVAPLCLEMALFTPYSFFFRSPVPVMWSAWQWVFTATWRGKQSSQTLNTFNFDINAIIWTHKASSR